MVDVIGKGNSASFQVSYDRTSAVLRLYGKDCYEEYKQAVKNGDLSGFSDRIEILPATVTPDGYLCSARGKATLKELVCGEETVGLELLAGLAACMKELSDAATERGLDLRDFVFDYNAVFVRNPASDYRFVYMPGLRHAQGRTTAPELVKIVFLNSDTDSIPVTEYGEICDIIKEMKDDGDASLLSRDLGKLLERLAAVSDENTLKDRFLKVLKFKNAKRETEEKSAGTPVLYSIKGTGSFGEFEKERRVEAGRSITVNVGRDGDWADIVIPSLFVSRKHAEIVLDGFGNAAIGDSSLNGTVVDGVPSDRAEKNILGGDMKICFAGECGVTVSAAYA